MSQANGSASSGKPITNAEQGAHSQTLDHVTSYPLVSDLLNFYTHNSLGAKSIEAFNTLYNAFVKPVLPYLQTPLSIASPYLTKADELGDSSLSYVDSHFPAVKKTSYNSLKDSASSAAGYPKKVVNDGRTYLTKSYEQERGKVKEDGAVGIVKGLVNTEIKIGYDGLEKVKEFVGIAKQEGSKGVEKTKKKVNGKAN